MSKSKVISLAKLRILCIVLEKVLRSRKDIKGRNCSKSLEENSGSSFHNSFLSDAFVQKQVSVEQLVLRRANRARVPERLLMKSVCLRRQCFAAYRPQSIEKNKAGRYFGMIMDLVQEIGGARLRC